MGRPDYYERYKISIHAPTRGATAHKTNMERKMEFQSTLLQEERHYTYFMIYDGG